MIIPQRIVLGILLGALLEYLIVIVSYLTGVVLHTPTTEPRVVTVVGIRFQTTVEIYDMVIIEHIVILQAGDRKSTRLNSSHANISYAVFCLKKKKHIQH